MNSDPFAGKWKQVRGKAKEGWGKLADDLTRMEGSADRRVGVLQGRCGYMGGGRGGDQPSDEQAVTGRSFMDWVSDTHVVKGLGVFLALTVVGFWRLMTG